jgi:replication factor C large subunit
MDWTEKYRPLHLQDLVGNTQVLQQMLAWARSWSPKSRPLLLYGKPGIGKTSSAHALARDMLWDVIELNASDQRTKSALDKVAGTSAVTASLSGADRKLILVDEVDNLHGTADRGGAKALLEIIARSVQPILLIANTLQDVPSELRNRCEPLLFRSPQARSIVPRLRFICSAEQIRCSEGVLREIAERAGGDVRAAITMLYAASIGRTQVTEEDLETAPKDERATIFDLVRDVFKGKPHPRLIEEAQASGETPDTILQWMEGSIHLLPDLEAADRAYRALARSDRYLGRTFRRQYYTLWRYAQALTLIGMAEAAEGKGIQGRIHPPPRWQHMGTSRRQRAVRASLLHKLSSATHMPLQTLREEYLTLFSLLVEGRPEHYVNVLHLESDELNLFLHDRERSSTIVRKVQEEEREGKKEIASPKQESVSRERQSKLF